MRINSSYFVSVTKLFSFKLRDETPVWTEFVLLQSTNLNAFNARMRYNFYSAFYWSLIGSDLLSYWVHELFIFVLASLIFIFSIILTLYYPDHSSHSAWVRVIEVWLYFFYYLCFSDNHFMRQFFFLYLEEHVGFMWGSKKKWFTWKPVKMYVYNKENLKFELQ